ncbi:MAG: biotin/lipoyl-containing protein [Victivallaceae bacterium]
MKVVVEVGEQVEAGATIMIVEAMKMETEIKAANAGTIADILVEVGNVVAAGDTLAVIEE